MKNFNQIYREIYKSSLTNGIESTRKQYLRRISILFTLIVAMSSSIVIVCFSVISAVIILFFALFLGIIYFFIVANKPISYHSQYKTKVIALLVKNYDEHLVYSEHCSMSSAIYKKGFDENFDIFLAEDYIKGTLNRKNSFPIS